MSSRETVAKPKVALMNAVHDLPVLVARDRGFFKDEALRNMTVRGATYENTVDNRAWE